MKTLLRIGVLLLVSVFALLAGWNYYLDRTDSRHKPKERYERPAIPLDLIGKPAADIRVDIWIHANPLPAKAGGKVRILDFWGPRCAPCVAALPKVQAFWAQHRDDLELIALTNDHPKLVNRFLAAHPEWQFPVAIEAEDSTASRDYDIRGNPTYIVINKEGRIVSNGYEWEDASAAALKLLGGK